MAHRVLLFGDGRITGTQRQRDAQAAVGDQLVSRMRMLDRKLLRDLRRMWAQALAIALVMASGVATYVMASGAYRSLDETRAAYYLRYRFADVFAEVRRAPKSVADADRRPFPAWRRPSRASRRLALLDVEGLAEPASGRAVSIPDLAPPRLNLLHLREGRLPERERTDEVTVNEAFAKAHGMHVGATFKALLNGKKHQLRVVGVALSPEFIYALGPGDLMPDNRRFAVLWMSEKALAALFDLDGAFNAVTLKLLPGASEPEVLRQLDDLLARYGGVGSFGRKDQLSHAFLDAELRQLDALRRVMPPIFLLVSAFLINITLSRMVTLEREQIGLLKALGYGPLPIAAHYVKIVLAITTVGILIGFVVGAWMGKGLTRIYAEFFHFPFLIFRHDADVYAIAGLVSVAAAVVGALHAVRGVLVLAPAVAMQPPAPTRYRRLLPARMTGMMPMSQLTVMALRHIARWPVRAGATALGIALGVGLLVTALLSFDFVELMIDIAFSRTERQRGNPCSSYPRISSADRLSTIRISLQRRRISAMSSNSVALRVRPPSWRNRSSMARLVAVVMFSPVSWERARARRSVSGSLMLRAMSGSLVPDRVPSTLALCKRRADHEQVVDLRSRGFRQDRCEAHAAS